MAKNKRQVGALPWRVRDHRLEVLLVTTRTTRRWVIPKGWPMKGRSDAEAAQAEAFEEAGIEGVASLAPFGAFTYDKVLDSGKIRSVAVDVYPLEVTRELACWPEQAERDRHWWDFPEAAAVVGDAGLGELLTEFALAAAHDGQAEQRRLPLVGEGLEKLIRNLCKGLQLKIK